MALTQGQSLSFYEILGPLGAGGMGEVYRARDTRLEREVAIKVLPEEMSDDLDRMKRFEREAKTLASLNHPNVAGIHGIDQVDDTAFIAMELVPGEDLAARLARGRLPVPEAIDVCRQIAEGLEAAHEAGVVHRDLKPANVRITPDGVVKILDFGLAKPLGPRASKEGTTTAETDSFLLTEEGLVLGTPTYMSPEQARAKRVDRRTDIWAFGCVLYECLTGLRAFGGESLTDVLAGIVEREPDWHFLPETTPPGVRRLLERCLVKDPRQRLRDVGDARIELSDPGKAEPVSGDPPRASIARSRLPWTLTLVSMAAALALLVTRGGEAETPEPAPRRQVRFTLRHPTDQARIDNPVVAPDGSYVVYLAWDDNVSRLWVRELAAVEPRVLPGTEDARVPFVSPDSRFVGFRAGSKLKRIAVSGGVPVDIADWQYITGAAWCDDGTILFPETWTSCLSRVPSGGGSLEEVTKLNVEMGETGHWWPASLPGGRGFLYSVFTTAGTLNHAKIMSFDARTGRSRELCEGAQPVLVGSRHVLYHRAGVYEIVPFDPEKGTIDGPPRIVLEDLPPLHPAGSDERFLSISRNGVLAYIERSNDGVSSPRHFYWLDREGELEALELPESALRDVELSPDDRFLAMVHSISGELDVFVHELSTSSATRLTTQSVNDSPKWSPDGERVLFDTTQLGRYAIFSADRRGVRPPELLFASEGDTFLGSLSPDGMTLFAQISDPDAGQDIVRIDIESGSIDSFLTTLGQEMRPKVSPDGLLLAYGSDVLGLEHLYVTTPDGSASPVKVSVDGGRQPEWTTTSKLAFNDGQQVVLVDVSLEDGRVIAGRPYPFVEGGMSAELSRRFTGDFTITSDGERVIVSLLDEPLQPEIEVVLDGFALLGIDD